MDSEEPKWIVRKEWRKKLDVGKTVKKIKALEQIGGKLAGKCEEKN